ncbi:hypothetical protein K3555_18795 [Leisingera sp. M527]|uniref:hypothetical protein n=1 Tax=Leisingera sp. M527 TaxID=2867014 RepID=UPI0021A84C44|nr:hypothetical protein [Leisingera sp. M527]UWQ32544.1 hypothetical protein K3555_18795 [Leisingera sp. M527]
MIALQDFSRSAPVSATLPFGAMAAVPSQPKLNCASAAELRQQLAADFSASSDWFTLCRGLRRKGICLRMRGGDLWVYDALSLAAISSCEDLGIDTDELELRFGPSQPQQAAAHGA